MGVRRRNSKWDPDMTPTMIPGFPRVLPQNLQRDQLDALLGIPLNTYYLLIQAFMNIVCSSFAY